VYWSAMALTTMPENSCNLDPVLKFVQVRIAQAAIAVQIIRVRKVVGCTHVILEIANSCKTADGQNE